MDKNLYNTDVYKIKSHSILSSISLIEALEYVLQFTISSIGQNYVLQQNGYYR